MLDKESTATVKSSLSQMFPTTSKLLKPGHSQPVLALLAALLLAIFSPAPTTASEPDFRQRTLQNYQSAKSNYTANSFSEKAAVTFGEACFDWADFAKNDSQRAKLAEEGIGAMRETLLTHPRSAAAHYWLGLNLGQLARTKTLGALPIVREMEKVFKSSIALDPKFNHAGAHRSLGLLYLEAPGWPTSIGNKSKAREHLEKAVELAPHHPENHLCLMEAYVKWNGRNDLARSIERYRKLRPEAKEKYSSDQWIPSWIDWDKRWAAVLEAAN